MKIAHIVAVFPPYKSGIGNACYQQVVGLAELGHQVTVFTPLYRKSKGSPEPIHNSLFNIQYSRPLVEYGNAAFVPSIVKDLNNFDVIHLHFPFIGATEALLFSAGGGSAFGGKKIRKPLIVQYHMDLTLPRFCSFLVGFYNQTITKNIFKKAGKIIISSQDYAENSGPISKFFKKNKEKFTEIPYGVDVNRFKPGPKNAELLKKYNISEKDKVILFVGGLDRAHYFKGVDVLLEALSRISTNFPQISLMIAGSGNLKPKYEKMAEELEIKDRVIFADNVENDELPTYYNLADVFVLPSVNRSESFGIVLLEAMACGKPCIASNLPGVRTVVDDGKTGFLVEPKNANDLAEKIKNILENEALAKKMGETGLNKVRTKYDLKKTVHQLESLYGVAIFHDREK